MSPRTALINTSRVTVRSDETLLQAALRQGIEIPNSCRVGGCATCKCKLLEGRVRQLTEPSYLLSDEELDSGVILACQSIPLTDIRIEVDLSRQALRRRVNGRVVAQTRLTHDITHLRVQLEHGLQYEAGQFAEITLNGLPGISRSYSFATPCGPEAQVEFFVRKVPGGAFSSVVNEQDLLGQSMQIDGPLGTFVLHTADAPLLFVAGGSGLAPVLAILKDALAQGVARPATLLFGARTADDLYALDAIRSIARAWPAAFTFVPVLSTAPEGADWSGARGLVTDHLLEGLLPGAHAYLCGPPAMIDAAMRVLEQHGMPRTHMHADRFVTRHAGTDQLPAPAFADQMRVLQSVAGASRLTVPARVFDYAKYALFHIVSLAAAMALLAGGAWITICLLAFLAYYILGDAVCGDDTTTPKYTYPGVLTFQLWLALPLLTLIVFAAVWGVCTGDPAGFGAWMGSWTGYDLLGARAATAWGHHVSGIVLTGLMIGMVGTITGHELTHRTWDRISLMVGRWLLAFSFDTGFSIEHVYGHHRYVSTTEDPATAPRGRNVYVHILVSTLLGNLSAWNIETRSLRRRGLSVFSAHNVFIRGQLMSIALVALAWAMGGASAAGFLVLCGLWGKALLEIVNYMEHYGMVRDPAKPVQPRHSWNTTKRISSWSTFNLTRHSHHHAQGEVPFYALQPFSEAPTMLGGYMTTIVVALIPPLWHHLMAPKLSAWDRDFASDDERRLLMRRTQRNVAKLHG